MHNRLTKSFQKVLETVELPPEGATFPEQFAYRRFAKKFEIPDRTKAGERRKTTFQTWVNYDQQLKRVCLPDGSWYRACVMINQVMTHFRIGELTFTNGSSSEPLLGMQSAARKLLTHDWECSPDCADLFVRLAIKDRAFNKAAKMRARRSLGDEEYLSTCRRLFAVRRRPDDVRAYWLYWNLTRREASRYSTVRKNNVVDRSIDLQPFINMVVQRAIGVGLRNLLSQELNVDLLTLADVHRKMVQSMDVATIDLRNASDSNTWSLVSFLYPKWFVSLLRQATPEYVEGLDGHYYVTNKVSSMGNGFTFELMTLTLLALTRQFDRDSSVFGDDIIIHVSQAGPLVSALTSAGWVVNEEKSFVDGPFRESCGANYHRDFGYIESYDFEWPTDIGECITFYNKVYVLRRLPYFDRLHNLLKRLVPTALRGPAPYGAEPGQPRELLTLDGYFFWDIKPSQYQSESWLLNHLQPYNIDSWYCFESFAFVPKVDFRKKTNLKMARHGLQYFNYLQSGMVSDGVITGRGDWVRVAWVFFDGRAFRTKSISKPSVPKVLITCEGDGLGVAA